MSNQSPAIFNLLGGGGGGGGDGGGQLAAESDMAESGAWLHAMRCEAEMLEEIPSQLVFGLAARASE